MENLILNKLSEGFVEGDYDYVSYLKEKPRVLYSFKSLDIDIEEMLINTGALK